MYLKAIPERTCIGCNEKKEKKDLIRIVKSQDGVIEAIYSKKYPIYAIQWHCELLTNKKRQYQMILSFFKQCKQYRFKKNNS